jgi:hypothetical protein
MTDYPRPNPAPAPWFADARVWIDELAAEAAADPKSFYGNKHRPADGGDRVRAGLAFVASLKTRLEALHRGA